MADGQWSRQLRGDNSLALLRGRSMGPAAFGGNGKKGAGDGLNITPIGKPPPPGTPLDSARAARINSGRRQGAASNNGAPPLGETPKHSNQRGGGHPPKGTPDSVYIGSPADLESPRGSVLSFDVSDTAEYTDDSVKVFVRVRPQNDDEQRLASEGGPDVINVQKLGSCQITCTVPSREAKSFTFDQVLWMTPQREVFEVVGQTMVEHCITGYNASIFAYGQTGAGKTYTMMGTVVPPGEPASEQRGLAPRVFEHLFLSIENAESQANEATPVRYSCRCSFLEIYNETITDLLNPASNNLLIREDQRSPFVENLTEVPTQNVDDVLALMRKGAENRHVGETRMNRESSRSHSVFTCIIEKHSKSTTDGVATVVVSRLNLIDLAGSERISSGAFGGSQVQGTHFKEAVHINKSLTTLGRVIMELVDAQRYQKRNCHIPYRDSRLTFLLQDSLGGNAKTMIIANVSPSVVCAQETLSTLHFVSRAKCIRNKAHINLDFRGDVASLQKEITRLNKELEDIRQNNTEAAFQAAADLRKELASEQQKCQELEQRNATLSAEAKRLNRERTRLEDHLRSAQSTSGELEQVIESMNAKVMCVEQAMEQQARHQEQISEAEAAVAAAQVAAYTSQLEALQVQLDAGEAAHTATMREAERLQSALAEAEAQSKVAAAQHASKVQLLESAVRDLEGQLTAAQADVESERVRTQAESVRLIAVQEEVVQLQGVRHELEVKLSAVQSELTSVRDDMHTQLNAVQKALVREQGDAEASKVEVAAAQARLEQLLASKQELETALAAVQAEVSRLHDLHSQAEQRGNEADVLLQQERQHVQTLTSELTQVHETTSAAAAEQEQVQAGLRQDLSQTTDKLQAVEASLEQMTHNHQQAEEQVQQLQTKLGAEEAAHAETRSALAEQTALAASTAKDLETVQQELAGAQEQVAQLRSDLGSTHEQLDAASANVAQLKEQLAQKQAEADELVSRLNALESDLQGMTATGQARADEVAAVKQQLREQEAAAKLALATLEAAKLVAEQLVQERTESLQQTQQDLERSEQQVETLGLEMEEMVAGLTQEKTSLLQLNEEQKLDVANLQAEQASLREQLEAASKQVAELQQESGSRLQESQRLEGCVAEVRTQLAEVQEQLQHRQAELDTARKEMAQGASGLAELSSLLAKRDTDITGLKRNIQESELQAGVLQREQQERISCLQRDLIKSQEQLVEQEFELTSQITKLTKQVEASAKDTAGLSRQLDTRAVELQAAKAALQTHQEALAAAQASLVDREKQLAEAHRKASEERDAAQLSQAKDKALIHELSQELLNYRAGRGDMEQQMKSYLLTNTRQNRAFQEIRRLIEWATTPPSSGRSSVPLHGTDGGGTPLAAPEAATSPIQQRTPSGQAGAGGAPSPVLPMAAAAAGTLESPSALRSSARSLATLYRLRSSLSLMASCDMEGPSSPQASPKVGLSQSPFVRGKSHMRSPRSGHDLRASIEAAAASGNRAAVALSMALKEGELCSPERFKAPGRLDIPSPAALPPASPLTTLPEECDVCSPSVREHDRDQGVGPDLLAM